MMKVAAKRIMAVILALLMCFSVTAFSADETGEEERDYLYSDFIKYIAKDIALFGRYDGTVETELYLVAFDAILKEHPELYDVAVKAMVESVDENSEYFAGKEVEKFFESLGDVVVGIGVTVLESDGNIIVTQPIPGSPAERAGIKSGDIIVAADDVSLKEMPLDAAVEYIKGPEGTSVKITIQRSGLSVPINVTIIRERVITPSVEMEVIEREGEKIAVITVYSFSENVAAQFKDALDKADEQNVKNLIIDLRDNGGGYLAQAVEMADMLLPADKLITTEDHKLDVLDVTYTSTGIGRDYEVVVLINGMSASASEVLTAALVENGEAISVGTQSFGKGTVQETKFVGKSLFDKNRAEAVEGVPDEAIMKYTVAYYLTPKGNNIHQKGITPDIKVENSLKPVDMTQFKSFTFSKKYASGDRGSEVENAKKMLSFVGLYYGEINDIYDDGMKSAVSTFQEAMGLYPYGVLDFTTQTQLYETVKEIEVEEDDQMEEAISWFLTK